jgi:hypothetical protein
MPPPPSMGRQHLPTKMAALGWNYYELLAALVALLLLTGHGGGAKRRATLGSGSYLHG